MGLPCVGCKAACQQAWLLWGVWLCYGAHTLCTAYTCCAAVPLYCTAMRLLLSVVATSAAVMLAPNPMALCVSLELDVSGVSHVRQPALLLLDAWVPPKVAVPAQGTHEAHSTQAVPPRNSMQCHSRQSSMSGLCFALTGPMLYGRSPHVPLVRCV